MSLNDINLPGIVVADFYKKNLVDIGDTEVKAATTIPSSPASTLPAVTPKEAPSSPASAAPLQYLGNNLKNVTILVYYPGQVYLPEDQLNFLSNILKACQLNIGDIAIVNNATQKTNLAAIAKELGAQKMLLFGDMRQAGIDIDHFSIKNSKGIDYLSAPQLELINSDTPESKILKGKLWNCLKQLFAIA